MLASRHIPEPPRRQNPRPALSCPAPTESLGRPTAWADAAGRERRLVLVVALRALAGVLGRVVGGECVALGLPLRHEHQDPDDDGDKERPRQDAFQNALVWPVSANPKPPPTIPSTTARMMIVALVPGSSVGWSVESNTGEGGPWATTTGFATTQTDSDAGWAGDSGAGLPSGRYHLPSAACHQPYCGSGFIRSPPGT